MEQIVTGDNYNYLKEWATRELYKKAHGDGTMKQVLEHLKAQSLKDPGNMALKKSIAEGHVSMRDWKSVVEIYEDMARSGSGDPAVQTRLIDYYILAGQPDKAIAKLEPLVEKSPGDRYNSDILMNAYVKAGMKDKALALFKKRVDADPGSPGLLGSYAQALEDFGLLNESLKEWQQAAKLDPTNRLFPMKAKEVADKIAAGKKR